jgi:hypothetical protein
MELSIFSPPQEIFVFFKPNPAFYTFLKEKNTVVEKVDFSQYINIWYIFFDLKKKSTTRIVVWARYLNLFNLFYQHLW